MKLPWVSRALYEQVVADYALAERWFLGEREANEKWQTAAVKHYDDLLARYHMLKLQGFAEPTPQPTITRIIATFALRIIRGAMLNQVALFRVAKLSDDEIIARIQRGNRPADEIAEAEA